MLQIELFINPCEIAPGEHLFTPEDFADDMSALVEVMAWCRQATSHYLSQNWHRSMSPFGITRPQCDNHSVVTTRIFWVSLVNIMATDGLGACVIWPSAAMVLILQDKPILDNHKGRFQLPGFSQGQGEMIQNANIDGLVQERCNSSALAMELHLSCTNPLICFMFLRILSPQQRLIVL